MWATGVVVVGLIAYFLHLQSSQQIVSNAASTAQVTSKLKKGDTAPEFKASTNAGPFDLASVSTPVLLEVFATWCPHCQKETSVLSDLATNYAGKVAFVAVSGSANGMDGNSPESQADVMQFGQTFNVRYPIAFDPNLDVAQKYVKSGFPTIAIIDKNKHVRYLEEGEQTEAALSKALNSVI
jgi:thiol-disulfide isomerase/thioredoxin